MDRESTILLAGLVAGVIAVVGIYVTSALMQETRAKPIDCGLFLLLAALAAWRSGPEYGKWMLLGAAAFWIVSVCAADALQFHRLARGDYPTPWYPPQWWEAPYTHAMMSWRKPHEYWTLNALGSERWHVREVAVGRVVFWTALERKPVKDA